MTILAIDVGGTKIKYGLVTKDGTLLSKDEVNTEAARGVEVLLSRLRWIADRFAGRYDRIGISTSGQIDEVNGVVMHATGTIPGYAGTDLRGILSERYHCPISVENDVNCAAIAEAVYGAGQGLRDFLCLTYGTGVGGAIFQDGAVYHGSNHVAGEFGHMVTHVGGEPCNCGGRGCYERYASTRALVRRVSDRLGRYAGGREIFSPALMNDPVVQEEVDRWLDEIALGLAGLIYIFNPAVILMGGGIMQEHYVVEEASRRALASVMPVFRNVKIIPAKMGNNAGMLGAAYLAARL